MRHRRYITADSAGLFALIAGCAAREADPNERTDDTDGGSGTDGAAENTDGGSEAGGAEYDVGGDSGSNGGSDHGYVDEAERRVEVTYGETGAVSNGVAVTVHGIDFAEQLGDETPEERDEFALLEIEAVNGGEEEARLPSETDPGVQLLFEDQRVDPTFNFAAFSDTEYEPYEGDDVQPGARREGYILYEVAGGLSESDADFRWQDDIFVAEDLDGSIDVRWTAG